MGIAIFVESGKASSLEVAKSEFLACSGSSGTIYDEGCDEVTTKSLCFEWCTVTEQSSCIEDRNSCGGHSHSLSEYFFCKSNTYAMVKTSGVQMPKDFDSNASSNVVINYHYCFWYTYVTGSQLPCMLNGARFYRNSVINNSIEMPFFFCSTVSHEMSESNFINNVKPGVMLQLGDNCLGLSIKNCVFIKNEYDTFTSDISKTTLDGCVFFECSFANKPELTVVNERPSTRDVTNPTACLMGSIEFSERKGLERRGLFTSLAVVSDA